MHPAGRYLPLVAVLSACSPAAPAPASPATAKTSSKPRPAPASAPHELDVQAMLERESNATLKPFRVVALGGKVTLTVLATAKPSVKDDKSKGFPSTQAKFDIGTEQSVDCTVLGRKLDTANLIRRLIAIPAGADGEIETVAAAVEHRGYIRVSGLFTWGPEKAKVVAAPKISVAAAGDSTLVCVHDELGYTKTFDRVVRSAVKTLRPYFDNPVPKYREVRQVTLGGANVGAAMARAYDRKDGTRGEADIVAVIVFGGGKIHAKDLAVVDVTDKSGALVSEKAAAAEDGQMVTKIAVTRTAPGEYLVEGTLEGKNTRTRLTAAHRLTISATRTGLMRSVASAKVASATFDDLDAAVAPAKIKTWTAKRLGGRKVLLSTGDEKHTCVVDAAGLCSVVELTNGHGAGAVIRRIDASGTP